MFVLLGRAQRFSPCGFLLYLFSCCFICMACTMKRRQRPLALAVSSFLGVCLCVWISNFAKAENFREKTLRCACVRLIFFFSPSVRYCSSFDARDFGRRSSNKNEKKPPAEQLSLREISECAVRRFIGSERFFRVVCCPRQPRGRTKTVLAARATTVK